MGKERCDYKEQNEKFLKKTLTDKAVGIYKNQKFQYFSEENYIKTSYKGLELYKKDLSGKSSVVAVTDDYFVFVKTDVLPDKFDCFPGQPEEWVQKLMGDISPET